MIVPVNNCNICLENSNKSISCIKCKNSYVCYKCLERLEKIGLNKKCPICRQEDWYNNIQDNKVIIDINFEFKCTLIWWVLPVSSLHLISDHFEYVSIG